MKKKSWVVVLPKEHLQCEFQRMACHLKFYQRSEEAIMFYLCQIKSAWNQMQHKKTNTIQEKKDLDAILAKLDGPPRGKAIEEL